MGQGEGGGRLYATGDTHTLLVLERALKLQLAELDGILTRHQAWRDDVAAELAKVQAAQQPKGEAKSAA